MNTHRLLVLAALAAVACTLAFSNSHAKTKDDEFTETGTLTEMQAVPCGSQARGFTGIGGVLATAGVEHVNSKDKLCQEYVLRTGYIQYRIRPVDEKDAVLLPVGEKSQFRIRKDHILLSVPEGDGKVREYKVVGMKPLVTDEDSRPAAKAGNAVPALQHRSAGDSPQPAPGGTDTTPAATAPAPAATGPAPGGTGPAPGGTGTTPPEAGVVVSTAAVPASTPVPPGASARSSNATIAVLPASSRPIGYVASPTAYAASPVPQDDPAASANTPLTEVQVMGLVSGRVSSRRVESLIGERGIAFTPSAGFLTDLKSVGASDDLLKTLAAARIATSAGQPARQPAGNNVGGAGAVNGINPAAGVHGAASKVQPLSTEGAPAAQVQRLQETEQQDRTAELARGGDPAVHLTLAAALGQEGKWSEAAAQYAAVVSNQPNDVAARSNLAFALKKSGDVDGAIREYRRALAIDPGLAGIHDNLGVALSEKGDLNGALAEFREAIRLDPASAQAHSNLGSILERRQDADGAIREFRQALNVGGGCCNAHYNLAAALESKGDLDGAVAEFRQALKSRPDDPGTHAALGRALERKGDFAGALQQYAIAVRLAPQDPALRARYDRLTRVSWAQNRSSSDM